MRRLWHAALILLAWISLAHAGSVRLLTATVVRVSDGDTLIADTDRAKLRIRLLGIDAPEIAHNGPPGQPFGKEAKDYLEQLVGGRTVRVEAYGRDQYHRVLAVLWPDGRNVNVAMVRAGFAELYRGARCQAYCRELQAAEHEARQARLGMWSLHQYESPRDYRRRLRFGGRTREVGWVFIGKAPAATARSRDQ